MKMDERILQIESFAMNAWPAREVQKLDGWRLRWHTAPSRRVNSVWPNAWGGEIPLAIKLEMAEVFYEAKGQPVRFQMCPAAQPADLDIVLEARGYTIDASTGVRIAETETVAAASRQSPGQADGLEIDLFESLNRQWVAAFCQAQGMPESEFEARLMEFSRIRQPTVYVRIQMDQIPVAVGRGVVEDGWLGIFGMATTSEYRRRGFATTIIHQLSNWTLQQGINNLYLQVMDVNKPAQLLYSGLGFENLYHYHYRQSNLRKV